MTWSFPRHINLTFGRRSHGCTNIPLAAVGAQEDETILAYGFSGHGSSRFSTNWIRQKTIRFWRFEDFGQRLLSDGFHHGSLDDDTGGQDIPTTAPPAACAASATMVVFLRRPTFRLTRFSNQRATADCGAMHVLAQFTRAADEARRRIEREPRPRAGAALAVHPFSIIGEEPPRPMLSSAQSDAPPQRYCGDG